MPAPITCPECGATLRIAAEVQAGQRIRCPACQIVFPAGKEGFHGADIQPAPRSRPPRANPLEDEPEDWQEGPRRRSSRRGREAKSNQILLIALVAGGFGLLILVSSALAVGLWLSTRASKGAGNPVAQSSLPMPAAPVVQPFQQQPPVQEQPRPPQLALSPFAQRMFARFRSDQMITVILNGVRDDNTSKYVQDRCRRLIPPTNSASYFHSSRGVMQSVLAPVGDPQTFANRIDFGQVTRVDGRVIYVNVFRVNQAKPPAGN